MTPAAILTLLEAAGLRLRAEGGNLLVSPKEALTDELRGLMREHKAELLTELQQPSQRVPEPVSEAPSPLSGQDCTGCNRLTMIEQPQPGTRRRFFWRCGKGHELLEGRNYGSRIIIAPPECDEAEDFLQWMPGTR